MIKTLKSLKMNVINTRSLILRESVPTFSFVHKKNMTVRKKLIQNIFFEIVSKIEQVVTFIFKLKNFECQVTLHSIICMNLLLYSVSRISKKKHNKTRRCRAIFVLQFANHCWFSQEGEKQRERDKFTSQMDTWEPRAIF